MNTSKIVLSASTWTLVSMGSVLLSNPTKGTVLWAKVATAGEVPTVSHVLERDSSLVVSPGPAGLVVAKLQFEQDGEQAVVVTPYDVADVKHVHTEVKLGCSTGDQVFTGLADASCAYQLDVSSDSALTGTLTVVYTVPGVSRLKVLKDTSGSPITINLADPRIVTVTGLHLASIGVRPTVAVAGGTYDVALSVDVVGGSSRG